MKLKTQRETRPRRYSKQVRNERVAVEVWLVSEGGGGKEKEDQKTNWERKV